MRQRRKGEKIISGKQTGEKLLWIKGRKETKNYTVYAVYFYGKRESLQRRRIKCKNPFEKGFSYVRIMQINFTYKE